MTKKTKVILTKYNEIYIVALAEFIKTTEHAEAEYKKICESALAKRDRICKTAWIKYDKTCRVWYDKQKKLFNNDIRKSHKIEI